MAENKELKVSISSNLDATGFNQAQSKIKDLSTHADKLSASFKTFAGLAASLGAVTLFKEQITQTLEFADSLNKLSQKTGITADGLYSLSAAAKLSDVDFASLESSLAKFSKGIGEASMGTGTAKDAFERLGVSIQNQDGTLKDSFALLVELSEQFQDMPDGAMKATTAMQLFGKSGADMIPLLNSGSDALQKFSGVMNQETAKAAEDFNDSLTNVQLSTNAFTMQIIKEMNPTIKDLTKNFNDLAESINKYTVNMDVAKRSVFDIKTSKDFEAKKELLEKELKELQKLISDDDGWLWFGLDERTKGQYVSRIARIQQQLEQLKGVKDDTFGKDELYVKNLDDRFTRTIALTKEQEEDLFEIRKDRYSKEKELAKKQAEDYAKAYKEISQEIAKTSMDDYDYGVYLINQKVEEYRKAGVKEIDIAKYVTNAKMELGIKQLQEETKEYEKAQQEKKQAIEHELKMLEEQYRIQSRQVNLLDDEVDRAIALAKIEHDRSVQSLRLQMDKEPELKALYEMELDYEDKLLAKTLENYTLHGQVINGIKDDLESGFGEFFDYQSDNFMKFGALATNILHEVYMEIVRISMIKPLASGLTSGLMSFVPSLFGGASISPASSAAASSVASGGSLTDAYFGYAKGDVFSSPSLSAYSNQVVSSPTLFAFASGGVPNMGVFGEAGSEAIMPLTRTSSGDLGVKATASNMKIEIKNESSQSLEVTSAQQTFDSEGAVLSIVINGIQKNKMGLRDMIGSR